MLSSNDVGQQELSLQESTTKSKASCKEGFLRLINKANIVRLGLFVLLSLCIEFFVWNSYYWSFDNSTFPTQELNLPIQPQLKHPALVVTKDNAFVTLDNINQMVSSIAFEGYGGNVMVKGNVLATSQNYAYKPQNISYFYMASGLNRDLNSEAQDYQRAVVRFDLLEPALKIFISFEEASLPFPLVITKVTINPEPELNFSWTRCFLMVICFYLVYITLLSKLYRHKIVVDSQSYKLINRGILCAMLLFSCSIMLAYHPHFITQSIFKFTSLGSIPFSTPEKTLLQEIPDTQDGLANVDIYIELTDALLVKKQLNLDLWIDPNLFKLKNMYDPTERDHFGVLYHLDRAFYDGKYYCYFGLAPFVLIYAPIYLLTGLVPSPTLAIFIATLYALLGMHFLSSRLTSLLCDQCNTTLFIVGKTSFYMCSQVLLLQSMLTFYHLPYLTCASALCFALGLALSLFFKEKNQANLTQGQNKILTQEPKNSQQQDINVAKELAAQSRKEDGSWSADLASKDNIIISSISKFVQSFQTLSASGEPIPFSWDFTKMLAMFMCGICVVLVVMSRPLSLLYIIVGIGLMYTLYILKIQQSRLSKLINSLCLILPVLLGAIMVAYYNYARFDTIFEFGQLKQHTGDMVAANSLRFNPEYIFNSFFNVLFENPNLYNSFPFVRASNQPVYTGQYTYFAERIGLFTFPFFWGLFLIPVLWKTRQLSYQGQHLIHSDSNQNIALNCIKVMLSLFYVVMILIVFLTLYNAGWAHRYITDISILGALSSFLFMMMLDFKWQAQSERIIFLSLILGCIISCLLVFFTGISNFDQTLGAMMETTNPRLFLEFKEIFDPLGFS